MSAVEAQPLEPVLEVDGSTTSERMNNYFGVIRSNKPEDLGTKAAKAFYSIALTQHYEQHDDDALRTLELYMRRFSGGKFSSSDDYKAALWLRVRILCLKDIDEKCRQAAYLFSKQASDGAKAGIADQITLMQ
jgi:hypothetical protein